MDNYIPLKIKLKDPSRIKEANAERFYIGDCGICLMCGKFNKYYILELSLTKILYNREYFLFIMYINFKTGLLLFSNSPYRMYVTQDFLDELKTIAEELFIRYEGF